MPLPSRSETSRKIGKLVIMPFGIRYSMVVGTGAEAMPMVGDVVSVTAYFGVRGVC